MVVAVAIFAAAETIFCTASRRFWLNGPSAMPEDGLARGGRHSGFFDKGLRR
jgi:hypothetical protein